MPETNEVFVDYEKYLKRYVFADSLGAVQNANTLTAGTSSTRQANLYQEVAKIAN